MLVDHGDAVRRRLDRIVDAHQFAVEADIAGVGQYEPDQHLHQRRLARAVLPEDAVDPPTVEGQVDAVAGDHSTEALGDPDQLDGGRGQIVPARQLLDTR